MGLWKRHLRATLCLTETLDMSVLPFPLEAHKERQGVETGVQAVKTTSIHHRTVLLVREAVAWALGLAAGPGPVLTGLPTRSSLGKLPSPTRDRLFVTPQEPAWTVWI